MATKALLLRRQRRRGRCLGLILNFLNCRSFSAWVGEAIPPPLSLVITFHFCGFPSVLFAIKLRPNSRVGGRMRSKNRRRRSFKFSRDNLRVREILLISACCGSCGNLCDFFARVPKTISCCVDSHSLGRRGVEWVASQDELISTFTWSAL